MLTRHHQAFRRSLARSLAVCFIGLNVLVPATAQACSLDGIASITANGVYALRTTDAPAQGQFAQWAPFTFGLAYAPGQTLHISENRAKLRTTLPATALAHPFRWHTGDGHTVQAMDLTYRYPQTGWYVIAVDYYAPAQHAWLPFDRVRIHILPQAALGQANLGYRAMMVLDILVKALVWIAPLAFAGLVLGFWLRGRLPDTTHSQTNTVEQPEQ